MQGSSPIRPATFAAARGLAERRATLVEHALGAWAPAGVLCRFYETPGPEHHATCVRCGASAVAKPDHAAAGSAVTLSCAYVQLMRRLARSRETPRHPAP